MKNYLPKYVLGGLIMGTVAFSSCNNAEYSELTHQAYIAQTATSGNSSTKITLGQQAVTQNISVRLSDIAQQNSSFELTPDPEALNAFNKHNETSYTFLPEGSYSLSASEITVSKGKVTSQPAVLTIKPLSKALKDSGKKYAIAFKLKAKDGAEQVLTSGSTMVYILDQVVYQAVPTINSSSNIKLNFRKELSLKEWTLEMNVNISILGTRVGELNNQTLFGCWAPAGKDGEIYTRFGDAPIEGNRLQVKTQGTQMNSNLLFKPNTWYHLAFVCQGTKLYLYVNGTLDNSMDLPGKVVYLSDHAQFGNQDYLKANVMVSELRLWTKARSKSEIANNMYSCDPTSPGLEAYWKLNEGEGQEFKDATGHGKPATVPTAITWTKDVRIDGHNN